MGTIILPSLLLLLIGPVICFDDETELQTTSGLRKTYTTFVDLLVNEFLKQEWDEGEKPCFAEVINILKNVQNSTLWATWIWDSIQLPSGQFYGSKNHLGNFDQCLRKVWPENNPVQTQYCLVDFKLADIETSKTLGDVHAYDTAESYFHIQTEYKLTFNTLSWGVCVPAVCRTQSIDRFVRTLFRLSHMGTVNHHPNIKIQDCRVSRTPPANITGLYLLVLSALILIVIATTCTYVTKKYDTSKSERIVMKIVRAFDLKSNSTDLMSTKKDDIKVMHGIRFLSTFFVVILHVIFINILTSVGNTLDMHDDVKRYISFMSHSNVVVDTYFMMSGLLLMKSFKPETGRNISPSKVLLKRYFRLIWAFIVIILIVVITLPFIYGGPLWSKYAKFEQKACEKTWWVGLLMLGNYVSTRNICFNITWYVPADYHLTALSTTLYWLYQKNRRGGQYLFGLVIVISLLLPGIYNFINRLDAVTVIDFETIAESRKYITGSAMYVHSHLRASPYFVGLIAGYIISVYKPTNYRNVISTKYSILGFVTIMALAGLVIVVGSVYRFLEYDALESAFFAAVNRPLWASLMAAFILLCEYGTLPLVTDFLGWSAFAPLSKLSYGIYMCHYFFVMRLTLDLRTPAWHDMMKLIQDAFGILTLSCVASLYITLFLESPLNNLVELVLKTKCRYSTIKTSRNVEWKQTKKN
ncbi:unnamed protein product, partial [Iphiclides podalirius]